MQQALPSTPFIRAGRLFFSLHYKIKFCNIPLIIFYTTVQGCHRISISGRGDSHAG